LATTDDRPGALFDLYVGRPTLVMKDTAMVDLCVFGND
jgi:hypothetical protein